ncbi:type II secretion system protein N [Yersinia thracica]|nr:type II secretion system protein N [Yersinia thracica]
MIMEKNKRKVPLLYEGEWSNNFINKTKMVKEIKDSIIFQIKDNDKEITSEIVNVLNSPLYTGTLKLVGVLEHTDEASSIVILELNGKQNLYLEGDEVEAITIVKILKDRIIINENGGHYTLVIL